MTYKRRPGFALIDIILVFVVLSVQMAVLYPLLEKANENSRSTTCKSRLMLCATGFKIYLSDWDDALPSSVLAANGGTPTQEQVTRFLTGPPRRNGDISSSLSWCDVLASKMASPDCIFCPSGSPRNRRPYWMKYAIDLAWRDPNIHAWKEAQYAWPADQVLLYEPAGWHVGDAAGMKNGVQINVAYMDTHVSTIVVQNGPTSYPPTADQKSGAAGIRLGEPMYYNYDSQTSTAHPGVADYIDPRRYKDAY